MSENETPDFESLMDMDASEAVRPPPIPRGTYRVLIATNTLVESSKKKTPGIEFTFTGFEPQSDVDVDKWKEYLASPAVVRENIRRTETFWVTSGAMWRLKEFCELTGAQPKGPVKKMVQDAMQQAILIKIGHTVGQDGQTVYNENKGFAKAE